MKTVQAKIALCVASGLFFAACNGGRPNDNVSSATLLAKGEVCQAAWSSTTSYPTGSQVHYKGVNYTAAYTTVGDNPAQHNGVQGSGQPWVTGFTCSAIPTPTPTPAPTPASSNLVGGYWPNWLPSAIRVRDVNRNYNLIYLFSAQPVGGSPGTTGAVFFNMPGDGRGAATNFKADIQYARTTQGRKVILSIGGAGNSMKFPDRTHSQNFVNSIIALYNQFGGFDGIDWDNFESSTPDTHEMIWISLQLKQRYPGFLITTPPAPWNSGDLAFCQAMLQAGALDYAGPQYYDGPNLANPSYVVNNIDQWVSALGATHVVIGFGVHNATNYMTVAQAQSTWKQVKAKYPTIHGGFNWAVSTDETNGWGFANNVGTLIKQ